MIYQDTDSYKLTPTEFEYLKNDKLMMKAMLNSTYGRQVMMNNDYIVIHREKKPVVIFKKYITSIEMNDDKTAVINVVSGSFYTDEKYADVIKRIM